MQKEIQQHSVQYLQITSGIEPTGGKRADLVVSPLLATGSGPKQRERGRGEMVCLGGGCLSGCESEAAEVCGGTMQIYVDDDGDKVGVVEKGEHVEFVDFVDFDSVFDFPHVFNFSSVFDFSRCWKSSGEVLTLYKKKADKVQPVSRPHEGGLRPGGKGNWRAEAISKEKYKPDGDYGGWVVSQYSF